jgi:biopolymer transport protein ExbD
MSKPISRLIGGAIVCLTTACAHPAKPAPTSAVAIEVRIEPAGTVYWNDTAVSLDALTDRLKEADKLRPQPEVHLSPDVHARYSDIAAVMKAMRDAGVSLPIGVIGGTS